MPFLLTLSCLISCQLFLSFLVVSNIWISYLFLHCYIGFLPLKSNASVTILSILNSNYIITIVLPFPIPHLFSNLSRNLLA
jgi:hypothetical protein